MKTALVSLLFLISFGAISAQTNTESYLNVGLGLSNYGLPVYGNFEFPIAQDINLSLGASYRSYSNTVSYLATGYRYRYSAFGIEGRALYYTNRVLNIPSEFDVYGGLGSAYYFWTSKYTGNSGNSPTVDYSDPAGALGLYLVVGGRYHWKKNLSLNAEVTGGSVVSGMRGGFSFRF